MHVSESLLQISSVSESLSRQPKFVPSVLCHDEVFICNCAGLLHCRVARSDRFQTNFRNARNIFGPSGLGSIFPVCFKTSSRHCLRGFACLRSCAFVRFVARAGQRHHSLHIKYHQLSTRSLRAGLPSSLPFPRRIALPMYRTGVG